VGFLDTLAVDTLWVGETEETFLDVATAGLSALLIHNGGLEGTRSFSFQKEKAMFILPWVSDTPAMPSSPQRKALARAMSYVKWLHASPLSLSRCQPSAPNACPCHTTHE